MDCCNHEGKSAGDARFEIKKVADGVHVVVAAPAYKVNSNTAIIESDDGVTIVDTHSKPSAARVIVERLREITTKPVRYVVNTHFHWDHWHGNEVYPAAYPHAEIVTNQLTREAMVRKGLKRIQDHVRQVPQEIAQLKADLAIARAPAERARLEAAVRLAESYLAEVRALRPALPTIAFEQTMKLYRRDREIHLLYLGRAHTEGDVFVYLPREKVVVTGDAVIGWTPFMGDGYPEDWVTTLDRLAQLDFTHIIMGHGDVAGRDWLQTFRGYVHDMVDAVRAEVAAGGVGLTVLNYMNGNHSRRPEDLFCDDCDLCRLAHEPLCRRLRGQVGVAADGGDAEYLALPARNFLPVPEGVSVVQMAREFGGAVIAIDRGTHKLKAVSEFGALAALDADTPDLSDCVRAVAPGGAAVAIDLVGTAQTLGACLEALGPRGRLVLLTTFPGGVTEVAPRRMVQAEISILGSRYASRWEVAQAARLVAARRITPGVSEVVPLSNVEHLHDRLG